MRSSRIQLLFLLQLGMSLVPVGCPGNRGAPLNPLEPGHGARVGDQSAGNGLEVFDVIVTPDVVFPDAAERPLYEREPPSTENERRVFAFSLKPQPGMATDRHFQFVTIAITRVKAGVAEAAPALSGTGGPSGGFVEAKVWTRDGRYRVEATVGSLLPITVQPPAIDPERIAKSVDARYDAVQRSP